MEANLARMFIKSLYKGLLERESDPAGLEHWTNEILSTGDALEVFHAFVESEEFRHMSLSCKSNRQKELAIKLSNSLKNQMYILDVGSLPLQDEPHLWFPLSEYVNLSIEGFDPQVKTEIIDIEPINEKMSVRFRNVAMALGDGYQKILYINNELPTSSMYQINESSPFLHLNTLKAIDCIEVSTVKLDDLSTPEFIDLLKLDVQGFELEILKNATKTLDKVAVLIVEVEYSPIYLGQPLFAEVDIFLRSQDFELVDLKNVAYPYASPNEFKSADTVIWADAIYRKKTQEKKMLNSQALLFGVIFGKWNIAEYFSSQTQVFD